MSICPSRLKEYSTAKAESRQVAAEKVLGKTLVSRIIGFALFLLGYTRSDIAEITGAELNTFLSFLTRISKLGLDGFRDRRRKSVLSTNQSIETIIETRKKDDDSLVIETNYEKEMITIPAENPLQQRVFLLSLGLNGKLRTGDIAKQLDYTPAYVRILMKKLNDGDVSAIIDKRVGQATEYRVSEEIKGELIIQWAANSVTGQQVSSPVIAKALSERCAINLPERTIRDHIKKLGLVKLAAPLSQLAERIKKGSTN